MRGLYIHIPFCKHICHYCDFPKRILKDEKQEDEYINHLISELDYYKRFLNNEIITIYIGGGTPNSLSDNNLEKLLNNINLLDLKNVKEYTIEINPELLTIKQINLFKKYKINRISIGVQSFNHLHLQFLGRKHTQNNIFEVVNLLKANGITNINVDLIYGFFYQTLEDVKEDLRLFYDLDIPHLSYYSMILEEKTKFYLDAINNKLPKLDDDLIADMYEYIINDLKKHGYKHYEISNFAKNDFESKHNKIYWQSLEYVGIGAGASGYLNHARYDNNRKLNDYFINFVDNSFVIDAREAQKEFLLLGLRLIDGIAKSDYWARFGTNIEDDFDFSRLLCQELIEINEDIIKLTPKGIMFGNIVFSEFI